RCSTSSRGSPKRSCLAFTRSSPLAVVSGWSSSFRVGLVVAGLTAGIAACAAEPRGAVERAPARLPGAVAQAPAIGTMAPNASRIVATVRRRAVWPPGSLAGVAPAVRPNRTLYSLTLEVISSAPAGPTLESLARPGAMIEAFSFEPLGADLEGTTVTAVVELTGTTAGTRWLISQIVPSR